MKTTTRTDIQNTYDVLAGEGDVVEVRAFLSRAGELSKAWEGWTRSTVSGYFDNAGDFARAVEALEGTGWTKVIYLTLNPTDPALLARAYNRLKGTKDDEPTTADHDIARRRWLMIDADPRRPSNVSSTDDEKRAAYDCVESAIRWLAGLGWPEPVIADSGNGYHALYRVDLPNDGDATALFQRCLTAIAMYFDSDSVGIDTTNSNAARLCKLYGTTTRKGDDTPTRPHRLSRIEYVPDTLEIVSPALLKELADHVPEETESRQRHSQNGRVFDVESFIADHGLCVAKQGEWPGRGYRWELAVCPFNSGHTDRSAFIVQFTSGAIAAGCHHNGCTWRWRDLREKFEGPREERQRQRTEPDGETDKPSKKPTTAEYVAALGELGYMFKLNECDDTVEVNGKPISDTLRCKIRAQMRDKGFWRVNVMEDAYTAHAYDHRYHPVKEYLAGLEWDGHDHLFELATYFEDEHENIETDKDKRSVFHSWLLRWTVGAVAKVFDAKQNGMLVLEGGQDLGKSYFVAWLGSPLLDYFIESPINPDDKDSYVRLMAKWIWEVAELGATTRRADREALKYFISQRTVTVRKPYGRYDVIKPAMASLCGTINNESGFLNDPTGNRRFLVVSLDSIDWSYTNLDVNQVWAQAVHLYRAGEPWRLLPEEKQAQRSINTGYEVEDPLEDYLIDLFVIDLAGNEFLPLRKIIDRLKFHDYRAGSDRMLAMQLATTAKKMGLRKGRAYVNGKRERGYFGIREKGAQNDDDEEMPF